MRHTSLVLRVALALTLTASPAAAQFTGVVAPPKARTSAATSAAAEAATPGARSDSAGRTALSDMRAWVDSAAGVSAPAATKRDSTRDSTATPPSAAEVVAPVPQPTASAADSTGALRAPDTATMIPAVALAGLLMLGGGAWLLRRSARA